MTLTVLQSVYKNDSPLFLSQALESLYSQTFQANKIVLVKDGCITEELDEVIEEWTTKLPIQLVGYDENRGLAHALNFGLQFVDTDLVARMDSDDICLPSRFEKQVLYFEEHPETKILGSSITEFYINPDQTCVERIRSYSTCSNRYSKTLFKGTPIAHPSVMARTDLLRKYKYCETTYMNEDIDLWFRLILEGVEIRNIHEPLLRFRITDGTFARRRMEKANNECAIYYHYLVKIFGFNFRLLYPIARWFVRFLPYSINKRLYFSKFRQNMFKEE